MTINSQWVQDIVIIITIVGGSILYAKNRIPQQNVKNLTALTTTYEKRINALEDEIKDSHNQQLENVKAISDLQGQIKVYKELPLQELAEGIKKVVQSNQEILATLKSSATILANEKRT